MPRQNGSIPLQATIIASKRQISCSLANESVILDLEDGIYYGLNSVAGRIWELVQEPRTVRMIRDMLMSEYDIEESACTRDLLDLLKQLHQWKLVELRRENGGSLH